MRYLLDTNVVSALRVRGRNPAVESWAAAVPMADQFVTALTVAEIERGVTAKERTHPAQGEVLRRWFEHHVLPAFEGRVVSFDLEAARVSGGFRVPEHAPFDDALIAAIAVAGDFTIVTRNLRHYEPLGLACVDPWRVTEDRPGD